MGGEDSEADKERTYGHRKIDEDGFREIKKTNSFVVLSNLFYVKNLLVCNEYHHEITLLSRVLSTLAAPL